jgi:ribosome-associated protein
MNSPREVQVREVPIELSQLLKFSGMVSTGGAAKQVISAGTVTVNGVVETRKGRKLLAGDVVAYEGESVVVSLG